MDNQRIRFLDVAKGLGIILVLLGHTYEVPGNVHLLIYAFHMPMFFVLSGYVYNTKKYMNYSPQNYLRLVAKRYLYYYCFFVIINIILEIVWKFNQIGSISELGANLVKWILASLYCYPYMDYMPNCSPIWFLLCLFWAEMIVWGIYRYLNSKTWCFVFAIFISSILSYTIDFQLPLEIAPAFMASAYMFLGIKIREYGIIDWILKKKIILVFILMIGGIAAAMNVDVTMAANDYGNVFLFLLSSCCLSVSIICSCVILSNMFECRLLSFLGQNTVILIGLNYFLRNLSIEIYYIVPYLKNIQITWKWNFAFTVMLSLLVCMLWSKRKKLRLFAYLCI